MKGKRHSTEEKIRILRKADQGRTIIDVCQEHNISEQTFHRWKREFGMLEVNQARRLKDLEKENGRLKRMVADQALGMELLQEALEKKL
jgi:putative transposase